MFVYSTEFYSNQVRRVLLVQQDRKVHRDLQDAGDRQVRQERLDLQVQPAFMAQEMLYRLVSQESLERLDTLAYSEQQVRSFYYHLNYCVRCSCCCCCCLLAYAPKSLKRCLSQRVTLRWLKIELAERYNNLYSPKYMVDNKK